MGDTGDPLFSIWRLSWVAHQLPRDPLHLFDGNIFYPELRTLAYSDAMLATALMAAPFLWLGVHQVVVYNIVLLLSFAASGVAMYALVRALTGDRAAAFVAGVAFAFYPFRFEHYSHLELQMTFWMPLALLMLHRTIDERPRARRRRHGPAGGAADAVVALLRPVPAGRHGAWSWLATGRAAAPDGRRLVPWLAAAAVLVVLVLPVAVPYLQNRGQLGERPDWEARIYSATPRSYLVAHVRNRLYGGLLDGPRTPEASLFPGLAIVALALAGAWPRLTRSRAAYVLAALVAFDGSLGAERHRLSDAARLRSCRSAASACRPGSASCVGLSLSVLAGYGVQRLRQSSGLKGGRLGAVLPAACAAVLLVENVPNLELTAVPARPPLIYDYFTGAPTSVLVDLPFPESLERATRGLAAPLLLDVPLADADHRQQRLLPRVVQAGGQDAAGRADGARGDVPPGARRRVHRARSRRLRGLGVPRSRSSISTQEPRVDAGAPDQRIAPRRVALPRASAVERNAQRSSLNAQVSILNSRPASPTHSTTLRPLGAAEDEHARKAGDEARDVGPERDAALVAGRVRDRAGAAEQLHQEPEAEEEDRRDLDDLDEDEQRDQRQHARVRVEHEVRAHHAGDRAARADRRHVRRRDRSSVCAERRPATPHSR